MMRAKIIGLYKWNGTKQIKVPFSKEEKDQLLKDIIKVLNKHHSTGYIKTY